MEEKVPENYKNPSDTIGKSRETEKNLYALRSLRI